MIANKNKKKYYFILFIMYKSTSHILIKKPKYRRTVNIEPRGMLGSAARVVRTAGVAAAVGRAH